jgi:hypothetical protein
MKTTINSAQALLSELMYNRNGRFVTVTFIKANGKERTINGRLFVEAYLKHKVDPQQADTNELVTIWDRQIKAYRSFNINRVISLSADGIHIESNRKPRAEEVAA